MLRKALNVGIVSLATLFGPCCVWASPEHKHSHGCEHHWMMAGYRQEMYLQLGLIAAFLALACAADTVLKCLRRRSECK